MSYEEVLSRVYSLRRDKQALHEGPHKPILLLTLLDLIEAGKAADNRFALDDDLFSVWKSYFDVVKSSNDRPSIENPIFHLCGDAIWRLIPREGIPEPYSDGNRRNAPNRTWLKNYILYGLLDDEVAEVVASARYLGKLREAIISRYFPKYWDALLRLSQRSVIELSHGKKDRSTPDDDQETSDARDGAFRKLILAIYDNRCTACGLRLVVGDIVIVDAAHLIPWIEGHDDHPTNGIALCKNHHWAMDRRILAPGIDRKWHVSPRLDRRVTDHRDLIALDSQVLFEPGEKKFLPSTAHLKWRQERLLT